MRLVDADIIEKELGVEDRDLYVQHILDSASTIEAKPVKHGRWIVYTSEAWSNLEIAKCSVCGYENAAVEVFDLDGYHYCPNCGARMDSEENDGTNR